MKSPAPERRRLHERRTLDSGLWTLDPGLLHFPERNPTGLLSDLHRSRNGARLEVDDVHCAGCGSRAFAADERVARVGADRDAVRDVRRRLDARQALAAGQIEDLHHVVLLERGHQQLSVRGYRQVIDAPARRQPARDRPAVAIYLDDLIGLVAGDEDLLTVD